MDGWDRVRKEENVRLSTVIMLGLALVFGVASVYLSRNWLERQAHRAPVIVTQAPREAEPAQAREPQETIVVAAAPMKFGAEMRPDNLKEIAWPSSALPDGAYRHVSDIFSREGRRVALAQIEVNEPVLATKVSNPGQKATLSAVIAEGMKAVTVRVDDVNGVAGFVTPGDKVDVLLTRTQDEGGAITEMLVEFARVLAVDQVVEQRSETPTIPKAVTLEVETAAAQKVAFASSVGKISLVLRRAGEVATAEERSRRSREATVAVGRGTKWQEYAVRSEATH
jgi:pilus assembly protein CpaB